MYSAYSWIWPLLNYDANSTSCICEVLMIVKATEEVMKVEIEYLLIKN